MTKPQAARTVGSKKQPVPGNFPCNPASQVDEKWWKDPKHRVERRDSKCTGRRPPAEQSKAPANPTRTRAQSEPRRATVDTTRKGPPKAVTGPLKASPGGKTSGRGPVSNKTPSRRQSLAGPPKASAAKVSEKAQPSATSPSTSALAVLASVLEGGKEGVPDTAVEGSADRGAPEEGTQDVKEGDGCISGGEVPIS
eukprot:Sspe_Gene.60734::Locus_33528_Transcript_1_1_Confidence_1.000_Length_588::g.60734::m.60734